MSGWEEVTDAPKKKNQHEHALSYWVDKLLDRIMLGDCEYTAVETGTVMVSMSPEARMNAEQKRRARGIKPYALDWYCYQRATGVYAQWELKVDNNTTTDGQNGTIARLKRNNIPVAVCYDVIEVWAFLVKAGFELHGNAGNIALEYQERYLAKRREAPKKAARSRKTTVRAPGTAKQAFKRGAWG